MLSLFFISFMFLVFSSLILVAFLTLLERKFLSIVGSRMGPFKVLFLGLGQPFSDAIKLLNKEVNSLSNFSYVFYYFSSFFLMFCSFLLYTFVCTDTYVFTVKFSVIMLFLILGMISLNSILLGWSIYSKFSLLGSIRSVSQLISYEVIIYMIFFFFFFFFH